MQRVLAVVALAVVALAVVLAGPPYWPYCCCCSYFCFGAGAEMMPASSSKAPTATAACSRVSRMIA